MANYRGFKSLGLEITKAALATGDKVIGTVRSNPMALTVQLDNVNLSAIILDVTSEEDVAADINKIMTECGQIDVLVNNAGFGLLGAIEETSDMEVRKVYETNVFGLLNVVRAVLPYFRKQRSGHIINMSSVGGLSGSAGWGIYNSTNLPLKELPRHCLKN